MSIDMVNKAIVGILVLIVLTSLGVGVLIGTQLGGDGSDSPADGSSTDGSSAAGGDATATASNGSSNGTATNGTATNGTTTATGSATVTASRTATPGSTEAPTATPTEASGETSTATPTPTTTTIPSYEFDTEEIENEMIEDINQGRSERGFDQFNTDTSTWRTLRGMVRVHSGAMASERLVQFEINGNTTESRYRGAELYDRCKYQDPGEGYIVPPDNSRFQAVGSSWAGQEFEDDGETRFHTEESEIAADIVSDWYSSSTYRRALVTDGVDIIAVGVTITDEGRVYAAAAICS